MGGLNISVALCTFNGDRFLGAQLKSIAAQQRPPDEVVICDDGSSDCSIEVIQDFARRSPFPTRGVVNSETLGSTKNFEKAITLCRGEIIALADQDDVWYPHKLERIEKAFLRSSAVAAAFSDADLIGDDSRPIDSRLWPTLSFSPDEQEQCKTGGTFNVLIRHPVVTGATMAFRKQLFELVAPIPANEIHDRWISFLLAICGQFEVISEPLMQYRRHGGQQIGPGPLTVEASFEKARNRGAGFYLDEIARFQQIHETVRERKAAFPHSEQALQEIERKISHLQHRARLPRVKVARIVQVAGEIVNGNYWRYSGGLTSLAKDLLLLRTD
jgi:glycosyltransferase involved in cell wall biosynthesis